MYLLLNFVSAWYARVSFDFYHSDPLLDYFIYYYVLFSNSYLQKVGNFYGHPHFCFGYPTQHAAIMSVRPYYSKMLKAFDQFSRCPVNLESQSSAQSVIF